MKSLGFGRSQNWFQNLPLLHTGCDLAMLIHAPNIHFLVLKCWWAQCLLTRIAQSQPAERAQAMGAVPVQWHCSCLSQHSCQVPQNALSSPLERSLQVVVIPVSPTCISGGSAVGKGRDRLWPSAPAPAVSYASTAELPTERCGPSALQWLPQSQWLILCQVHSVSLLHLKFSSSCCIWTQRGVGGWELFVKDMEE